MIKQSTFEYRFIFYIVFIGIVLNPWIIIALLLLLIRRLPLLRILVIPYGISSNYPIFAHWRLHPSSINDALKLGTYFTWLYLVGIISLQFPEQTELVAGYYLPDTLVSWMQQTRAEAYDPKLIKMTVYSAPGSVIWFYTIKLFWEVLYSKDYFLKHQRRIGNQDLQIEQQSYTHLAAKSLAEYFNLMIWFVILYRQMIISGDIIIIGNAEMPLLDLMRESFLMMVAFGPDNIQAVTWQSKIAMLAHSFTGLFITGVLFSRLFHIEDRE